VESVQERSQEPIVEEIAMWYLLDSAPEQLDDNFFRWLQTTETALSISFGDWNPSNEEALQINEFLSEISQEIPRHLRMYYDHAYPFDRVKHGASLWRQRLERYKELWAEQQLRRGLPAEQVQEALSTMPVLWPVDCFHRYDTVAFQTPKGDLAIVHIDAPSAIATGITVGLRDYFMAQVALYIVASELDIEPEWNELLSHPMIASFARWPDEDSPRHICLES
jgi:hypothetical protein